MDTGSPQWRTSSYSSSGGGQCIEVGQPAAIAVRDSKDRTGTVLTVPAGAWQRFVSDVKFGGVK